MQGLRPWSCALRMHACAKHKIVTRRVTMVSLWETIKGFALDCNPSGYHVSCCRLFKVKLTLQQQGLAWHGFRTLCVRFVLRKYRLLPVTSDPRPKIFHSCRLMWLWRVREHFDITTPSNGVQKIREGSHHGIAYYCVHCSSRPEVNEIYNATPCSAGGIAKRE